MFQVMSWISNVTCCGHLLCSMIWSESWLFVLFILVKLLTVLLELSFHNEHKLCCTLSIDIFSLSRLNNILKQSSFLPCQTLAIFWRNTFKPGTSKPESYKHYWLYLSPFFFYSWFRPSQEANLPGIGHVVLLTCSTTVRVLLPQKPVNKDWSTYRKDKKQRYTVLNLLSDIDTELTHWSQTLRRFCRSCLTLRQFSRARLKYTCLYVTS